MNSPFIFQIIAGYLDARSLIELSRVSKSFRKLSFSNEYWQNLLFIHFSGTLDLFGEIIVGSELKRKKGKIPEFFKLYKYYSLKFSAFALLSTHFSTSERQIMRLELHETLKNPMLPPPVLRREGKNFSTIIQDLIGNAISEPASISMTIPTESEEIIQNLVCFDDRVKNEFCKVYHLKGLVKNRWGIKGRLGDKKGWIVYRICQVLKGCFKAHCKVVYEKLAMIEDYSEFMSEYCLRWEAYSAAANNVEMTYAAICKTFNEVYDWVKPAKCKTPAYSLLRIMIIEWRRQVFEKLHKDLINGVLLFIEKIRKSAQDKNFDMNSIEQELILLSRVVLFIIDFGGNELSFQYIDHTKFDCEESYLLLEQKLVRITEQYYGEIYKSGLKSLKVWLKQDYYIISRLFLQRTQIIIEKLMVRTLIDCFRSHYYSLYKEYGNFCLEDLPSDPMMYTSFGKMLFSNDQSTNSTRRIRGFFEYLRVKKLLDDVNEYNELVSFMQDARMEELKNEKNPRDEEIEYINNAIEIPLVISATEKHIFSLYRDIDYDLIEIL